MKNVGQTTLLKCAVKAMEKSYSPYSSFRVGAALQADDGTIFLGSNVENASYGLTICAERVALTSAVVAGRRRFKALAVVADGRDTPYPCGACLQVLVEFCDPAMPVFVASANRLASVETLPMRDLLPRAFRLTSSQARQRRMNHPATGGRSSKAARLERTPAGDQRSPLQRRPDG
jgi:cytidine deaminase